jgi:hypothetical protein
MKNCKHCEKQYGAENANQYYCCDVCRQQAYYKRHGIDRSQRGIYGYQGNRYVTSQPHTYVNPQFTPINNPTGKDDVNPPTKEIEQLNQAPVSPVAPLIETKGVRSVTIDNFGAILEQMNKTHQAQMEAMETRLKLSFAQEQHLREKEAKEKLILQLQDDIKEMKNKSSIDTQTVLGGLSNMIAGIDIEKFLKAQ